jgi:hypothetical protein
MTKVEIKENEIAYFDEKIESTDDTDLRVGDLIEAKYIGASYTKTDDWNPYIITNYGACKLIVSLRSGTQLTYPKENVSINSLRKQLTNWNVRRLTRKIVVTPIGYITN